MWIELLALFVVYAGVYAMTGWWHRYALRKSLLDIPNHRSSHRIPTPSGGGIGFVSILTICALLGIWANYVVLFWLIMVALPLAVVGWLDDVKSLSPRSRLYVQCVCVFAWTTYVYLESGRLHLGVWSVIFFAIAQIWFINLYNFMDGIDGIAALQACAVSIAMLICLWAVGFAGHREVVYGWCALLVAMLAFLTWNWPPARVFMGDIGSTWLGMVIGGLLLWSASQDARLWGAAFLLPVAFWLDASITLIRRARRGAVLSEAHRSHAYQHLARRWSAHLPVSLIYAGITLVWALPWSLAVAWGSVSLTIALMCCISPLAIFFWRLGAGVAPRDV